MLHELLDGLAQPDGVGLPHLPSCVTMLQLDAVLKLICMTCIAATHGLYHPQAHNQMITAENVGALYFKEECEAPVVEHALLVRS